MAIAALMIAGSLLVTRPEDRSAEDQIRREALEAARAAAISLTTYDYRTLDEDFARVSGQATGEFQQEYAETSEQLKPALLESQAVATSEVPAVGIASLSTDPVEVEVVVAVDQTITTAGAAPRTEYNRIRMTLVRTDEAWLVGKVERL
jgi:Mce-associated membrane protein